MSQLKLLIPDRYEMIVRLSKNGGLRNIVIDVPEGLGRIDSLYEEMESTGRGSFLVLYGKPGSGKSTLLNTVPLFREGVEIVPVEPRESIPDVLDGFKAFPGRLRIVIIKAREALANTTREEIEAALLSINNFVRSDEGKNALIAWPCSLPAMRDRLVEAALGIGGPSLLGSGAAVSYGGPSKEQYIPIARSTIATFNAGATFLDWGITEPRARQLADEADTIGTFLQRLLQEARSLISALISKLPERERSRLWIVVAAGNDPESDINALTRGAYYQVDIERLLLSTDANISLALREDQARVGLLGTLFDARLLLLPMRTAMALVRDFAQEALRGELAARGFHNPGKDSGQTLLRESDLARALLE
jgi:DNA (cytosine-5)-methyltransferase 1